MSSTEDPATTSFSRTEPGPPRERLLVPREEPVWLKGTTWCFGSVPRRVGIAHRLPPSRAAKMVGDAHPTGAETARAPVAPVGQTGIYSRTARPDPVRPGWRIDSKCRGSDRRGRPIG